MGFRNLRSIHAYLARKSNRYSRLGRELEEEVYKILLKMKEQGLISDCIRHPPHSVEDRDGKDFSVTMMVANRLSSRSFGITISKRHWQEAISLHRDTPQFCFPIGTNRETIEKRILQLFN